ncbi:hypothetical protein [Polaromonas sp. LjRoot131]|uniref:hypothetical protein n=1 Tax=Polaromonas sp. LjRoot131 TaxID=3342262 RepID=UPI003ED146DA
MKELPRISWMAMNKKYAFQLRHPEPPTSQDSSFNRANNTFAPRLPLSQRNTARARAARHKPETPQKMSPGRLSRAKAGADVRKLDK